MSQPTPSVHAKSSEAKEISIERSPSFGEKKQVAEDAIKQVLHPEPESESGKYPGIDVAFENGEPERKSLTVHHTPGKSGHDEPKNESSPFCKSGHSHKYQKEKEEASAKETALGKIVDKDEKKEQKACCPSGKKETEKKTLIPELIKDHLSEEKSSAAPITHLTCEPSEVKTHVATIESSSHNPDHVEVPVKASAKSGSVYHSSAQDELEAINTINALNVEKSKSEEEKKSEQPHVPFIPPLVDQMKIKEPVSMTLAQAENAYYGPESKQGSGSAGQQTVISYLPQTDVVKEETWQREVKRGRKF